MCFGPRRVREGPPSRITPTGVSSKSNAEKSAGFARQSGGAGQRQPPASAAPSMVRRPCQQMLPPARESAIAPDRLPARLSVAPSESIVRRVSRSAGDSSLSRFLHAASASQRQFPAATTGLVLRLPEGFPAGEVPIVVSPVEVFTIRQKTSTPSKSTFLADHWKWLAKLADRVRCRADR